MEPQHRPAVANYSIDSSGLFGNDNGSAAANVIRSSGERFIVMLLKVMLRVLFRDLSENGVFYFYFYFVFIDLKNVMGSAMFEGSIMNGHTGPAP